MPSTNATFPSELTTATGANAYMLTGRAIYTMDESKPRVEAVGVVGDRIVATGTVAEVEAALPRMGGDAQATGRGPIRIDLGDRMLVPGFTDSHNHFAYLSRKWQAVDLDGCATVEEALGRVRDFVARHPDALWIDGHGWDGNVWGKLPTRFDLDNVIGDRPVALSSKDGHALWANTKALSAAGFIRGSGQEPGPELPFDNDLILRDGDGAPTGIVYETAVKFILNALPAPSVADVADAIAEGIATLHAQGITAVHCPEQVDDWRAYAMLRAAQRLGVRVTYWLPVAMLEEAIALGVTSGFGDEWLRYGPVKLFQDGTLGQRTAAMLAPFEGEPHNTGVALYDPDELALLVGRAAEHGFAVAIHAIGDRAVRDALNAVAKARLVEQATDGDGNRSRARLRHRIEHAQLVHPDDVARFAELDVIASMQPLHWPADEANAQRYWGERTVHAFPFRSLLDAGATLAFGSDAPFGLDLTVNSFSVLGGIAAAAGRNATVEEALRAFTIDAAWAGGEEQWRGSLTPGKVADMVVLSEDLMGLSPEQIGAVRVEGTIVAGRPVYERA